MNNETKAGLVIGGVLLVILLLALAWAPVTPGNEKVLMNKNKPVDSLSAGWHLTNPFTENTKSYSVRPQIYTQSETTDEGERQGDDSIESKTVDGNKVFVDVAIRYRITDVIRFHEEWGDTSGYDGGKFSKFEHEKIRSPSRDQVRDIVGTIDSARVHQGTAQQEVEERLEETMSTELENSGAGLIDIDVRNIRFSGPYQNKLEEKAKAKQEFEIQNENARAEANAKIVLANADKNATIIRAEGEAEANRKIEDSLSEDVLTWEQIQAYENATAIYVPIGEDGMPVFVSADQRQASG